MPYRAGFGAPESRLTATASAIVPASIIAGAIGTACLMLFYLLAAMAAGEFFSLSLEGMLSFLVVGGFAVAVGSIAGAFVTAFYLVIFGLPVALLLGERIRTPKGLAISMATGAGAAAVVSRFMWSVPWVSSEPLLWEHALVLGSFVLPAAWFYRRQVIAMLDELPD